MEQIPQISLIGISHLICLANNHAPYLCSSKSCQQSALFCGSQTCKCFKNLHLDCDFISVKNLYQRMQEKRRIVSDPLKLAFAAIDRMFVETIDLLSQERGKYVLMQQNYGLTVNQARLLNYLTVDRQKLTGSVVHEAKASSKGPAQGSFFTKYKVKNFWKKQRSKLDQMLRRITSMVGYMSQNNLKENESFQWDQQRAKDLNCLIDQKSVKATRPNAQLLPMTMSTKLSEDKMPIIWALKIDRVVSNVGIGVCSETSKKRIRRYANMGRINYGMDINDVRLPTCKRQAIIYNNGTTSLSMQNMGLGIPFYPLNRGNSSFVAGDIMYMCFDYKSRMVQFNKNLKGQSWALGIDESQEDDDLYPCCTLVSPNESVSIIEVKQQDKQKLLKLLESVIQVESLVQHTNGLQMGKMTESYPIVDQLEDDELEPALYSSQD